MTKEKFIKILAEAGIPERHHEGLWEAAVEIGEDKTYTEEKLKSDAEHYAPLLKAL